MQNYIEFIKEDNSFTAKIHRDGKVKIIKKPSHIHKLMKIAEKYGYENIHESCYFDEFVREISIEYQAYYHRKKSRSLKVYNTLNNLMKLKNSKTGKIIMIGTLASILSLNNLNNTINTEAPQTYAYNENMDNLDDETLEDYEIDEETFETEKNLVEMENMLIDTAPTFTYEYDNSQNIENFNRAKENEDLFQKYGKMYGIDSNLLMAIAAQESGGNHYSNLNNGPAIGIMQIEKSANLNSQITAYNHLTGEEETLTITEEALQNLETNIQIGAMILQNTLELENYNILLALQTYNFGPGNMEKSLTMCQDLSNVSVSTMKNDMEENEWRYYREFLNVGDPYYVEHVLSYLNCTSDSNISEITVLNRANQEISLKLKNEALTNKTI